VTAEIPSANLLDRVQQYAREWRLEIEDVFETETSAIAFVNRRGQALVLKVVKRQGDEWNSGEILKTFQGKGVVPVYEHAPGAVLMQRLLPGHSLVDTAVNGRDEEATEIIAGVIKRTAAAESSDGSFAQRKAWPTVHDWARGFDRYIANGDDQIPIYWVETARRLYAQLCASQRATRLLHGDLQHYNILFDAKSGWVAIDPKGVIGEVEYEIGAALRNPCEQPDLFLSPAVVDRRLRQFTDNLKLNYERVLGWSFAQAVLSAIWQIEDTTQLDANNSALRLAGVIQRSYSI
jgi:streptomycin 6-kinase